MYQQLQPCFSYCYIALSFYRMSENAFIEGDIPELFLGCNFTP